MAEFIFFVLGIQPDRRSGLPSTASSTVVGKNISRVAISYLLMTGTARRKWLDPEMAMPLTIGVARKEMAAEITVSVQDTDYKVYQSQCHLSPLVLR